MKDDSIEGWVAECKPPSSDVARFMGYFGAALFFKTRKDAREFVRQWRDKTDSEAPVKVRRAELKSVT